MEAFHTLGIEETLKVTKSSPSGLSKAEAQKRLGKYGQNSLPESKTKPLFLTFLEQFKSPIIIILLIASTISFIIGEVVDAWFILAVLGINAVIGTYLEHSAAQKAQALKSSVKTKASSNIADIESLLQQKQFEWIGFAAIVDPLREGVKEAVKRCQQAGIAVAMVTGDHPSTAYHIAKELEIAISPDEVMDAEKLNRWAENGSDPKEIADKRVFARVEQEQKLQIVQAFQQLGHYVAVTGDGVNDAPVDSFTIY